SPEGFPDIVAVHAAMGRIVFAELKSAKGKLTDQQEQWLDALNNCTRSWGPASEAYGNAEVYLWRPADVDTILEVFLGHRLSARQPDRDSTLDRDTTTPGGPTS